MEKLERALKAASIVNLNEQVDNINLNICGFMNKSYKVKSKFLSQIPVFCRKHFPKWKVNSLRLIVIFLIVRVIEIWKAYT